MNHNDFTFVDGAGRAPLSRRDMLLRTGTGLGMLGLAGILGDERMLTSAAIAADATAGYGNPMAPKAPQFAGKAKHIIHLFANGGPSHVDTFDPKPTLAKYAGKEVPNNLRTERKTGAAFPSPFKFKKYGKSGIEVSELFAKTAAAHVDDMCIVRSMYADVPNHEPSLMLMNCGELPADAAEHGLVADLRPWARRIRKPAGLHRDVPRRLSDQGRRELAGGVSARRVSRHLHRHAAHRDRQADREHPQRICDAGTAAKQLDLLEELNKQHLAAHGPDPALEARIHSFELAYRMQIEAADAFDVSREPQHVLEAYGEGTQARQILIARRLRRARRALRASVARRGPAVGQPRRSRKGAPHAGRSMRPSDRRIAYRLETARAAG